MKEIKNVSIIGMGALGVMYGSHLAHHMGFDHVTYIMDEKRYEKYKGSTVTCNGEELSFTCVPASQAVPADLVIVAVKSTGLTEALDTMKNCSSETVPTAEVLLRYIFFRFSSNRKQARPLRQLPDFDRSAQFSLQADFCIRCRRNRPASSQTQRHLCKHLSFILQSKGILGADGCLLRCFRKHPQLGRGCDRELICQCISDISSDVK